MKIYPSEKSLFPKRMMQSLKQIAAFSLLLTSLSCSKESNFKEAPGSSTVALTPVQSDNADEFSHYLSSLPQVNRDTALRSYAARLKEAIDKNNTESKIRRENMKGASTLSTQSTESEFTGYTPTIDLDNTQTVTWIPIANIAGLWQVESSETVTVNVKGDITGISHDGSMLKGTTVFVSWTQGIVQIHFTPQVGLVNVAGTITVFGVSNSSSGLLTMNAPSHTRLP